MFRAVFRALGATGVGAIVGALGLAAAYPAGRDLSLEMAGDHPSFVSGLHAAEREGDRTFAWTGARTTVRLAGLDRRVDWTCTAVIRGARDASQPMPSLTLSFDGMGATAAELDNEFEDVTIDVPARQDRPGLTLTLDVAPTFVPGAADPRELGAQVDAIRCVAHGHVWPPDAAIRTAALVTGSVAGAAALAGAPLALIAAAIAVMGAAVSFLLTTGPGAFGEYPGLLATIGAWAAGLLVVAAWAPVAVGRRRLSGGALIALVISVVAVVAKLGALEHASKPLIDAVFQAHRLEWVMQGRYFFTQPMPSGVQFPYAIGLYVTALPFTAWITDHVLLVRLVVVAVEALAGLGLYAVVARGFEHRPAAVGALVLFHLVPGPYVVIGNANLTNAFAQAVGLLALCGLALMPVPARRPGPLAAALAVTAAIALAFLSHVGTIVIVASVLGVVALGFVLARRRDLTMMAVATVAMTAVAALLAVGLYYRHFPDVYREALTRVQAPAASTAAPQVDRPDAPAILVRPLAWHERVVNSARQTESDIGWPILVLAVLGLTRLGGSRDRVRLLMMGWGAAWALLLVGTTVTRVDVQFQRYTLEFVSRINLAGYPMLAALAALGAAALWTRGAAGRVVAIVLVAAAVGSGLANLANWLG